MPVAVWRTVVACAIMVAGVTLLRESLPSAESIVTQIFQLVLVGVTGAALYGSVHLGLWRATGSPTGAETHTIEFFREKLVARRAR